MSEMMFLYVYASILIVLCNFNTVLAANKPPQFSELPVTCPPTLRFDLLLRKKLPTSKLPDPHGQNQAQIERLLHMDFKEIVSLFASQNYFVTERLLMEWTADERFFGCILLHFGKKYIISRTSHMRGGDQYRLLKAINRIDPKGPPVPYYLPVTCPPTLRFNLHLRQVLPILRLPDPCGEIHTQVTHLLSEEFRKVVSVFPSQKPIVKERLLMEWSWDATFFGCILQHFGKDYIISQMRHMNDEEHGLLLGYVYKHLEQAITTGGGVGQRYGVPSPKRQPMPDRHAGYGFGAPGMDAHSQMHGGHSDANVALETAMGELSLSDTGAGAAAGATATATAGAAYSQIPQQYPSREFFGATGGATAGTDGTAYSQYPRLGFSEEVLGATGRAADRTTGTVYSQHPGFDFSNESYGTTGRATDRTAGTAYSQYSGFDFPKEATGATGRTADSTAGTVYSQYSGLDFAVEAIGATGRTADSTAGTAYSQYSGFDFPKEATGATGRTADSTTGTACSQYSGLDFPVEAIFATGRTTDRTAGTAYSQYTGFDFPKEAIGATDRTTDRTDGTAYSQIPRQYPSGEGFGATGGATAGTAVSAHSTMSRRHFINGIAMVDPTIPDDESTYFPEDKPNKCPQS